MKHEKAAIIVLSYFIGFLTAYIGFGTINIESSVAVSDFVPAISNVATQKASASTGSHVIFDDTGMFVAVDDVSVVISGKLQEGIKVGQGFHTDVPFYEISNSGEYVYYCEQETESQDFCNEYIYVVANHTIHHLSDGSVSMTSPLDSGNFSWLENDLASYNNLVSESQDNPWKLIQAN